MSGTAAANLAAIAASTTSPLDDAPSRALPPVVALPVIGGLSAGLWALLWCLWRAVSGG